MTDTEVKDAPLRRQVLPGDIDDQGNVIVWDHGEDDYDGAPLPLRMEASTAGHAMQADPDRYAMEPAIDDGEVQAEIEAIQVQRETAAKVAADRAAAIQLEQDRRAAVATVAARHLAAEQAERDAPKAAARKPPLDPSDPANQPVPQQPPAPPVIPPAAIVPVPPQPAPLSDGAVNG